MLEPVSTTRRRTVPSISNVIEGARRNNRTATLGFPTFSGTPSGSELSPLSPLTRFRDLAFPCCLPLSRFEASRRVNSAVSNVRSDFSSRAS